MIATEIMEGMKYMLRKKETPLIFLVSRNARTRARGISTASFSTAKKKVLATDIQYLGERWKTRTKLSRPTKRMVP